jgi:hypothetical protein
MREQQALLLYKLTYKTIAITRGPAIKGVSIFRIDVFLGTNPFICQPGEAGCTGQTEGRKT